MNEDIDSTIQGDSVSKNVIIESLSRILVYVGGLVSSALLFRAIQDNASSIWKTTDYANLKILMSWNSILLVIVIMGITTAIVKSVSENTGNRKAIGTIISTSITTVTALFVVVLVATTVFAEPFGFLLADTPEKTTELRVLWLVIIVSMLPAAYIQIASSVFTGIQRMNKTLIVGIVYNSTRIVILLYLFFSLSVSIITVLWMYLFISFLGCITALGILTREVRKEDIPFGFSEWERVARPLFSVASVFAILAFTAAFFNYATTLFVDFYGTPTDVARFSIAQSLTQTFRSFLYTPFAVLLPNLAGLFAQGNIQEVKKRFESSNRIIIPTLIFTALVVFTFGQSILGAIYGLRGIDTSGGVSAFQFLQVLSVNLLIIPLTGLYTNMLTATGRLKILLVLGISGAFMQALWIIFLQPHFGVIVIAYSWVVFIPLFLSYHFYCRKVLVIHMRNRILFQGLIVSLIFLPIAYITSGIAYQVATLPFIEAFNSTTIASIIQLSFVVPLWYGFIGICLVVGLMRLEDIENLKRVLKRVPPVWWISRPLIGALVRITSKARTSVNINN